ncbi:hypothetical protein GGR28_001308 [Lewinella aquimaris]|uniref:TonB-dependent receptor n=1 Tax=Neolewinella aquimaris TaxID=1835722 RepID=A0A840E4W9_9BACT|nr:TonB-dependent receptor [Neolewinella aquimaris]MBB4078695.1 hypothetical protein [Neolewinella aquimaris]
MRLFLSVLLPLLSVCTVHAQLHPVVVHTVEEGRPLTYINVRVVETNTGGTTDAAGNLRLELPRGRYTLEASFLGYETTQTGINVPTEAAITLNMRAEISQLETVTVKASDISQRLDQPQMGVERLTIKDIEVLPVALGEVDVFRGLQLISGVNSAGEASNGLSIRGGTIDQNLILLDGAPIFTPTHLFGLFSVFTPDAIGGVDLYRGNIPARFGGRVSSILDVRSRTPSAEKLRLQGGVGLVSSHLSVETPVTKDRKLAVLVAGRAGFNDFAFKLVERLKRTRSNFVDGTLRLRYVASEKNIYSLSTFYSKDFYEVNLLTAFSGIVAESNQNDYYTFNNTLDWLRIVSDRTSLQLRLVASDHRPKVIFPQRASENVVEYASRIRYKSGQLTLDYRSGGDHHLSGGLQLIHYDLNPGQLDPGGSSSVQAISLPGEQSAELSLFAEDVWEISDRLTFSAGLRYTQFLQLGPGEQRFYSDPEDVRRQTRTGAVEYGGGSVMQTYGGLEPRLGMNLKVTPTLSLKAAYARSSQYLHNIYNSTTPLPSSRWKVSDELIRPQRSALYSGGLFWLPGEGKYGFNLETYYRYTDNMLEYRPGADFFLNPAVETALLQGVNKAYGVEIGISREHGYLKGMVNYAYARTLNRVDGSSFATSVNRGEWYSGYFDQPHTLNLNLTLDDERTNRLSFNFVAQSNRPYTVPNGFLTVDQQTLPIFLERNNDRLPVYHRLDFSWTIHNPKMVKKRWVGDWTFTVYNLYGRKNAYNIYYTPRDAGSPSDVFGSSPLGSYRLTIFGAPIVSLTYNFKFE